MHAGADEKIAHTNDIFNFALINAFLPEIVCLDISISDLHKLFSHTVDHF